VGKDIMKEQKNNGLDNQSDDLVVVNTKKKEDMRKKHNSDILNKMKDGEALTSFNSMDSWFPPRPKIEKDKELLSQLYDGRGPKKSSTTAVQKPLVNEATDDASADSPGITHAGSKKDVNKKPKGHLRSVD
jgi:hypothetical protein